MLIAGVGMGLASAWHPLIKDIDGVLWEGRLFPSPMVSAPPQQVAPSHIWAPVMQPYPPLPQSYGDPPPCSAPRSDVTLRSRGCPDLRKA